MQPDTPVEIWDPVRAWPSARRAVWGALAVLVMLTQGPGFVRSLKPAARESVDFFQEWASARNFLDGAAIYTDLEVSAVRYLERTGTHGQGVMVSKNAHPPASVLLALPFGLLDYPLATLLWNILSLVAMGVSLLITARVLRIDLAWWGILPAVTLLLLCNPLRQQVNQGQFNMFLLLLLTGVWAADRSGKAALAGALLGIATALKIFPGFVFLYFLLRRRWRSLAFGIATAGALSLVTLAVLGFATYHAYLLEVYPSMHLYRNWWSNASLAGFWEKWFASGAVGTVSDPALPSYLPAIAARPVIARAGLILSAAAVLLTWAGATLRARSRSQLDAAFGLTLTTMLLISPIAWDHYFLLLLLPVALVWIGLTRKPQARLPVSMIVVCLWLNPVDVWVALIPQTRAVEGLVGAVLSLAVISYQFIALLGLFASELWITDLRVATELRDRTSSC